MEKPGSPFFNFFRRVFGRVEAPPPPTTNNSVPIHQQPNTPSRNHTGKQFATHFDRDNPTMMKQLTEVRRNYRRYIESMAQRYNLPPAVICGIGSRESHWGLALKPVGPGGRGDFARRPPRGIRRGVIPNDGGGYGRGLMQVDYDWHEFARTGKWYVPEENINYACQLLDRSRTFFRNKRLGLSDDDLLRAMLAAYNGGNTATLRAIKAGMDIDANTTGRDYSKDVLNRSGWFQLHGWS